MLCMQQHHQSMLEAAELPPVAPPPATACLYAVGPNGSGKSNFFKGAPCGCNWVVLLLAGSVVRKPLHAPCICWPLAAAAAASC